MDLGFLSKYYYWPNNFFGIKVFVPKNLGEENIWLKIFEEFLGETILGVNTNFVLINIMDQTKIW